MYNMHTYYYIYIIICWLLLNKIDSYYNNLKYKKKLHILILKDDKNINNINKIYTGYDHRYKLYNNITEKINNMNKINQLGYQLKLIKFIENKKCKNELEKINFLKKIGYLDNNSINPINIFENIENIENYDI